MNLATSSGLTSLAPRWTLSNEADGFLELRQKRDNVRIVGDLGIGSSLEQIDLRLKSGILSADGTRFMFLLEAGDGAYGDGYLISLDESKQVTKIYFGRVPHDS